MPNAFDPYHKWLGIPLAEQPPNHYRLLGTGLFENDPDVIEGAADRQMAHVRTFQSGQHSALSQQILNELAAAKLCLLNPQKKAAYDALLRSRTAAAQQAPAARPQPIAAPPLIARSGAANVTVAEADCPDAESLSDFALGKLDAPAGERVSRHLAACAVCRQKVADVSSDGFVDLLRAAVVAEEQPANPGHTFIDHDAVGGLETTIDVPKAPPRVLGRKPRSARSAQPDVHDHPDYEIIKELGHGGMGVVYLARNRLMDRLEVLKVLSQSLMERSGSLERFQQEIRSAAKLSHINIVAAYAVLRMVDSLVFAMEYVPGQDLAQVVSRRGPLRVANAAYYAHQAALGLQHAHEKGMVHRDIKPNNLMLAVDGKKHIVKILDFGLAKATSEKDHETGLTKSGQILGTPDYLAPEQSRDAQRADIRADIYSLGCTLYFLLSGQRPFAEASLYDVLDAHQRREATPLDQVRAEVPPELAAVVAKMMAKAPEDRYQTPLEVAKALIPFFKHGQIPAPPVQRHEEALPQYTMETAAASEQPAAVESSAVPAVWPAQQAPLPLSPPRAVPIAVPLSQSAFDTSIDFESPLIDTHHDLAPQSRRWRLYLATCLAAVVVMLGVAIMVRTPHGTIEIEPSDPEVDVAITDDGNRVDLGLDEPLSLELRATKEGETAGTGGGASEVASSDDWVPLFNGKDLTGWSSYPSEQGTWRVENGILIGTGAEISYLFSERGDFANFHLRVEARINKGGDSGIFCRTALGGPLYFLDGYEAQINNWEKGDLSGSLYANGRLERRLAGVTDASLRPNEWCTLELVAADNHIEVKVNGQTTAEHLDDARQFVTGHIALQQFRPHTVVEFRKVEIKELPLLQATQVLADQARVIASFDARGRVDMLKLIDPMRDAFYGQWKWARGALVAPATHHARLQIPYDVPDNYKLTVVVQHDPDPAVDGLVIGLRAGQRQVCAGIDCYKRQISGLELVDGREIDTNPTTKRGRFLRDGEPNTVNCTVHSNEIRVTCNDTLITDWKDDVNRLSLHENFRMPNSDWLFIACGLATFRITKLELISLDGQQTNPEGDPLQTTPAKSDHVERTGAVSNIGDEAFQKWLHEVEGLPAEQLAAAVLKKLRELNHGSPDKGQASHKIDNGAVTEFAIHSPTVQDLSPLRAFRGLKSLTYSPEKTGRLADLSPLAGMSLKHLVFSHSLVSDLPALKGMPLKHLDCSFTKVADLSPLGGLPITSLNVSWTPVTDLSPLKGMPLASLNCHYTRVADLSPLSGSPLTNIDCSWTEVSDLSPLKGMPHLTALAIGHSKVADLSALRGMHLTDLDCDVEQHLDLSPLEGMPLEKLRVGSYWRMDLTPLKNLPLKEIHLTLPWSIKELELLRSIKTLALVNYAPAETLEQRIQALKARKKAGDK